MRVRRSAEEISSASEEEERRKNGRNSRYRFPRIGTAWRARAQRRRKPRRKRPLRRLRAEQQPPPAQQPQREFDNKEPINAVALHPDQATLLFGDHDGFTRVLDLQTNKIVYEEQKEGVVFMEAAP